MIKKNPLLPIFSIVNSQNQKIDPLHIAFMEPNITISAINSYDPDNTSSILSFTWTCPAPINDSMCKKFSNGVLSNRITIPLWFKLQNNL